MSLADSRYVAVAAAQLALSREVPIMADGKWGRYTQAAYDSASATLKRQVDDLLRSIADVTPADLAIERATQRLLASKAPIDRTDMRKLIRTVAEREGVPYETAIRIGELESRLNPNAVSPTGAKGLFQLTSIAVRDIAQRGGLDARGRDLMDPELNATLGMKYMKIVARDLGVRLNDVVPLYMGFNIGPAGAKKVLAGKPELAEKQISLQAYGPPAEYQRNLTSKLLAVRVA